MTNTEERIDQVLQGLNAVEVPARLEQRVIARVAQNAVAKSEATGSRLQSAETWLARLEPYAIGAAVALLVCAGYFAMLAHRAPHATQQAGVQREAAPLHVPSQRAAQTHAARAVPARTAPTGSAETQNDAEADSDAVALAETLAPSHPAPPMPATPQERVPLRNGRAGQSVEMAELRTTGEPGFRTARERTAIRQYILGLLDPLVTAQNLTSSPPPPDDPPSSPALDNTSTN